MRGPDERLLDACIHCGLCLDTCPTFVTTGLEPESPRGRLHLMRGLADDRWGFEEDVVAHLDSCLGCRACETACPSGVRYGELLEETRAERSKAAPPRSRLERFLVRSVFPRPGLLERAATVLRAVRGDRLAARAARWPLPETVRQRLRLAPVPEPRGGKRAAGPTDGPPVFLLRGCAARAFFPATEAAHAALLAAAGYRVHLLGSPGCCGALAAHAGESKAAAEGERRLRGAMRGRTGILVTTAAGCGSHVAGLDLPDVRAVDLLVALGEAPRPLRFRTDPVTVAYQDACHLRHGLGLAEEPRDWLRRAGATVLEPGEADLCCGSAGTYNLALPGTGAVLGERKAALVRATGAPRMVTANPGCALQMGAHLRESGVEVITLARFLAERLATPA